MPNALCQLRPNRVEITSLWRVDVYVEYVFNCTKGSSCYHEIDDSPQLSVVL